MSARCSSFWTSLLARQFPFSLQPYDELAAALRRSGHPDRALDVEFAGKDLDQAAAPAVLRFFSKWVIGYGYFPYWALYWAAGFVLVGMLVVLWSGQRSKFGDWRTPFFASAFIYSFDMLLPLVHLRRDSEERTLDGGWQFYFYLHRIFGFILASFVVAWIAGLTK